MLRKQQKAPYLNDSESMVTYTMLKEWQEQMDALVTLSPACAEVDNVKI